MPTRTPDIEPIDPRGTPTREQLIAYARGKLSPAEQHAVEAEMERDPLVRDAVDGLMQTGALDVLPAFERMRPATARGTHATWWIAGGVAAVLAVVLVVYTSSNNPKHEIAAHEEVRLKNSASTGQSKEEPIARTEIEAAEEQPAGDRIGHERLALHTRETARMVMQRDAGIERVDPRKAQLERKPSPTSVRSGRPHRSSAQLMFLHDLKLVDPTVLYGNDPQLDLADEHVAARFADAVARDSVRSQDHLLSYTKFMDEAIGRFANNDHKGCLDDLRFVLTQYPDDVNALFYAGLCAYNLGLYDHALTFLHRAATHPVDVFDEEAAWYHALTLDRMHDPGAMEAFKRIAAGDGFYSELAKARTTAAN